MPGIEEGINPVLISVLVCIVLLVINLLIISGTKILKEFSGNIAYCIIK